MVNLDEIIDRLKARHGLSHDKDVAYMLAISPADMSNRKRRGTLLVPIIDWAIHMGEDLNQIVYGEARPRAEDSPDATVCRDGSYLHPDEERLLHAYREAGPFQADLVELVEIKAAEARVMARIHSSGLSPPEGKRGAGGGGR